MTQKEMSPEMQAYENSCYAIIDWMRNHPGQRIPPNLEEIDKRTLAAFEKVLQEEKGQA